MKYIFLLIITAWLAAAISLSSCKKEPKPEPEPTFSGPKDTMYVDPEFKRYWYFPEGSWWVYKRTDTTAEVYDTVAIYNSSREILYYSDGFPYAGETLMQNLSHSSKYFDIYNKGEVIQNISNSLADVNRISSGGFNGFFSYSIFFNWPIESSYNKYIIDTNNITLPIGNLENVIHFTYWIRADVWMAKDIGFIKYIHYNHPDHNKGSSTWDLVNYHINK